MNQFNWTEQELIAYEQELKRIRDNNRAAEDYLIEKGIEKGKAEEKIKIAKNMLLHNIDMRIISASTGLSIDKINSLKS